MARSTFQKTQQRILRAAIPSVALALLSVFWYNVFSNHDKKNFIGDSLPGTVIRFFFVILLTIGMEYVARYEHQYIWHSRALWFFHASHHHQQSKFGSGPSKDDAESNSFVSPQSQSLELNDTFAAVFASVAMVAMHWSYNRPVPTYLHDIIFGCSCGISIYGTSYFIGHDLCAHERGGVKLAKFLRSISPTMTICSDIHRVYHHKIDVDAAKDDDPYGPPYGFWLGPQEVEAFSDDRELKMPLLLRVLFTLAGAFTLYEAMYAGIKI